MTSRKLVLSIIAGLLMAALHFTLARYLKTDTCPEQIRELHTSVGQQIKKHDPVPEELAELVDKIRGLDLVKLYREHVKNHYGEEHLASLVDNIEETTLEQADPQGIIEIYEALYEIQGQAKVTYRQQEPEQRAKNTFWDKFINAVLQKKARDTKQTIVSSETTEVLKKFVESVGSKPFIPVISGEKHSYLFTAFAFIFGFLTVLLYGFSKQIYTKILLGMIAGAAFGYIFGAIPAAAVAPFGKIFIRLIKMVVVPLVFASLTLGVLSLGDIRKVGRIGGKTLAYYLITTSCAISIGLVLANIVRPGSYVAEKDRQKYQEEFQKTVQQKTSVRKPVDKMVVEIVPTNPIQSMAGGNMLQIIFFALLFGMVLATISVEKKDVIEKGLDGLNDGMIKMVVWIMEVAPFGVFALMADTVAKAGISILSALAVYALVVLAGLMLHIVLIYGTAVRILAKTTLVQFFKKIYSAQLIAFSTSSSAATLPVSMRCAEDKLGVSKEVSSFVLPLGATINMDGTALYQGVAAVFIAQVYSIPLDFIQQLTILLTATLASIGTAAVPGAGIVILAMVLESIGVPTEGIALIMGVDRILDMCRTTVNVTGDLSATLFVHKTEEKRAKKA